MIVSQSQLKLNVGSEDAFYLRDLTESPGPLAHPSFHRKDAETQTGEGRSIEPFQGRKQVTQVHSSPLTLC